MVMGMGGIDEAAMATLTVNLGGMWRHNGRLEHLATGGSVARTGGMAVWRYGP
jgi:hypothetical protein